MKFSSLIPTGLMTVVAVVTSYVAFLLPTGVVGDGFELNADTCDQADKKDVIPFHKFHLENEMVYGPLIPDQVAGAPLDCLPAYAASGYYGAWYRMHIPGLVGMQLEVKAYSWSGGQNLHAVGIMQGSCSSLTCVANIASALELEQQHLDGTFTVTTNTPYYILYTIAQTEGAYVPHFEFVTATPEAACQLHRSDDILDAGYGNAGWNTGSCTPCVSSTSSQPDATGAQVEVTTWTTTCTDACAHCYNTTNPLYQASGPFCYKESREWTMTIQGETDMGDSTKYCYAFDDAMTICDAGPKSGSCPLEVNGVACTSCEEDHSQTGCQFPNEQYGVFKADCSNVDGGGVVDKCAKTGFDSGAAMTDYGIYTDLIAANNTPGQVVTPSFQSQCTFTNESGPDPNIITFAPTPVPNDPIELEYNTKTEKAPIATGETVQYTIDVEDRVGILHCKTSASSGDVDLYVAIDKSALDLSFLSCSSERYDSNELCDVVVSGNNEVSVNVYGYSDSTDVELECQMRDPDNAHEMDVGVGKHSAVFDLQQNEMRFYKMNSPENSARISCNTEAKGGDLDLFMRLDTLPVPFVEGEYDCQSIAEGGDENCEVRGDRLLSGPDIYILMQGYSNVSKAELFCNEVLSNQTVLSTDNAEKLDKGKTKSRFDLLENEQRAFYIDVPDQAVKAWCDATQHSDDGTMQLYTKVGGLPQLPTPDVPAPTNDDDQCSNGYDGHCQRIWEGGTGSTQFYAVLIGEDSQPVVGVDIKCNVIVPFKESDARRISGKKTFNLAELEEIGYYWDVQEHTGEVKCTTTARSGDIDIHMSRNWPDKNGGNDCDNGGGSDEECSFTYGNDGSAKEKMYILLDARSKVDHGEIRCSAKPSEQWKQNLQDQGGSALSDFIRNFNSGST